MARLVPFCALAGCVAILAAPQADAALVISSAPTSNVSCSAGICTATAADAVLNAAELAAMLASADTRVSSGDQAQDLEVAVSLTWTQSTRLTLNALRNLTISAPVVAEGEGTVALNAGHGRNGGDYGFAGDGRVDFWSTGDKLTIRKKAYKVVDGLAALADAIASNPGGRYALAKSYDAGPDGVYAASPVATEFKGDFDGLGHTVSNLSIDSSQQYTALFATAQHASFRDLTLSNVNIHGDHDAAGLLTHGDIVSISHVAVSGAVSGDGAAGLGGYLHGTASYVTSSATVTATTVAGGLFGTFDGQYDSLLFHGSASGDVTSGNTSGGLVAYLKGNITESFATGNVAGDLFTGGLVGEVDTASVGIQRCYATGDVRTIANGYVGGLIGKNGTGSVADSYARGSVTGPEKANIGGLIGFDQSPIFRSYAIGAIVGGRVKTRGAFVGYAFSVLGNNYWDVDTAGSGLRGAGICRDRCRRDIVGLSDAALKAALPDGFSPQTWGRDPAINDGYPYLLALPPS